MERKHTNNELLAMVRDKNLIIAIKDIKEILATCWPLDYKDTFIVPEGEALCFRGGGILVNGKNDVPGLEAVGEKGEKWKTLKLLKRRSDLNRILDGETDCLNKPLTPEAIEQFKRERDLIQEDILKAVEPLLDPDSIITQPDSEKSESGPENSPKMEENNGGISLPPEIDRPEARKAFEKALIAGYLKKTSTGYKWQKLPKAAAAYLCVEIYCPAITDKYPDWGLLGQFLGLSRLDRAASQNLDTKSKRPWVRIIDELLED